MIPIFDDNGKKIGGMIPVKDIPKMTSSQINPTKVRGIPYE